MVVAGAHSCALSTDGAAYCWGFSPFTPPTTGAPAVLTPTPVPGTAGIIFQSISVSKVEDVTCALSTANIAYCWGENDHGQLGDGTTISRELAMPVKGDLRFRSLAVGNTHVCGLTLSGTVDCWGFSANGALGDTLPITRLVPAPSVSGVTFESIAAGGDFTCGLTASGVAYCWGLGISGQLGDGSGEISATPLPVAGGLTFRRIVAGGLGACGLTAEGQAYCWGDNFYGTVGDGTRFNRRLTPVPVAGNLTFANLTAGYLGVCGTTLSGAGYCWGYNFGQVGDGTQDHRPTPSRVAGGLAFATVAGGTGYSCGLTLGLTIFCWGDNSGGGLGDGTIISHDVPEPIRWP